MLSNIILSASLVAVATASAIPRGNDVVRDLTANQMSIKQVRNGNYTHHGALSVYKTYLKFNATIPDSLRAAAERSGRLSKRSDTGSVAASPSDTFDDSYLCPVSIGTPAQTLYLDFDTGSSDLWVFSSETESSDVDGQTEYDPSKSSTATLMTGSSWDISYGDGSSSSGDVYTDVVTIGGLSVTSQAVETAETVSTEFTEDSTTDGLVGLGFDSLNSVYPEAVNTFLDNALSQLPEPLFTADLKHEAAGTYNFGYIDDSAYTGDITYVDVDTYPGYWTFTSSGYGIGSESFVESSIDGIADTGTTLLYLPDTIVSAYYKQVSSAEYSEYEGGYVYDCSADLPTFTFGVGSARIEIPGDYLDYGVVETGSSTCFGGLQSSDDVGLNIFGDVALKSAFVVFEASDSPRLGWAAKDTSS